MRWPADWPHSALDWSRALSVQNTIAVAGLIALLLTALGGFPNGEIVAVPELLDAAEIVAEEAAVVARALGFELGGMRRAVAEITAASASNRSSMLQDLEAGRPTEVGAIQEAIVAAGARSGVATPATRVLAVLIRARERAAAQENPDVA